MSDFLKKQGVQYFIIGLIVLGVLLVVFNPSIGPIQQGANFAVHIILAYLVSGMFFLILNQRNLMLTSFGACVILCLFLKGTSNSSFLFPQMNRGVSFKIAHVDVSSVSGPHDGFMKSILNLDADIVSFQEVDLGWKDIIDFYFKPSYEKSHRNIRLDQFGMLLYSKHGFVRKDTIVIEDYPVLVSTLLIDDQKSVKVLSSYTMPNLSRNIRTTNRRYFNELAKEILKSGTPVINLGKYNMPYWNPEISNFEKLAALEHSRRDALTANLDTPIDNIYFTAQLECTGFEEILDNNRTHLGVIGTYQFKEIESLQSPQTAPTVERF